MFYVSNSQCQPPQPACTWAQVFQYDCYPRSCIWKDPKIIKEQLMTQVFGQRTAINRIITLLNNHMKATENQRKMPVVLHFAGDHGVGKSMSADIVSEYAFRFHQGRPINQRKALLYLNMDSFKQGDEQKLSENLQVYFFILY